MSPHGVEVCALALFAHMAVAASDERGLLRGGRWRSLPNCPRRGARCARGASWGPRARLTSLLELRAARSSQMSGPRRPLGGLASPEALVEACTRGDVRAVEELLTAGGDNPLHAACWQDRLPVIQLLLDRGADPNRKDASGSSCLHLAVATSSGYTQGAMLLDAGANLLLTYGAGWSALHLAARARQGHLVDLLLTRGADAQAAWPSELRSTPEIEARLRAAAEVAAPGRLARRRRVQPSASTTDAFAALPLDGATTADTCACARACARAASAYRASRLVAAGRPGRRRPSPAARCPGHR